MLGVGFWNLALLAPRPPVKALFGLPSDFATRYSDFPDHSSIRSSPPVGPGRCWKALVASVTGPRTLPPRPLHLTHRGLALSQRTGALLHQGTVELPSRVWLLLTMKRFFSWTPTDGKNQSLKGSLVSLPNADVSGQRRLPRNGHRIPIAFLDADAAQEEQRVPIRVGAIEFSRKSVSKERLERAVCSVLGCP